MLKHIHDLATGEITEVEMTPEEVAEREAEIAAAVIERDQLEAFQAEIKTLLDEASIDFSNSELGGLTANQVGAYLRNQIDAWTSLADARADLRVWIPFMAKVIIALLKRGQ